MGGQKSKFQDTTSSGVPESVILIIERCIKLLPIDYAGELDDEQFQTILSHAKKMVFEAKQVIINKGEPVDGIYILVTGVADVVAEDAKIVIATLEAGDFFGEISVLYEVPATATIVTSSATCAYLDGEMMRSLGEPTCSQVEWSVKRHYLPTLNDGNQDQHYYRAVLDYLKQVPMLRGWEISSLEELSSGCENSSIVLYPKHAVLVYQGDPAGVLVVLCKGRVEVSCNQEVIVTVRASKYPFCFGEEGIFSEHKSGISVCALTPCQVMCIKKSTLMEVDKKMPGAGNGLNILSQKWKQLFEHRDEEIFQKYPNKMQFEMVFLQLRGCPALIQCEPGCLNLMALDAVGKQFNKEDRYQPHSEAVSQLLLVVFGGIQMVFDDDSTHSRTIEDGHWLYLSKEPVSDYKLVIEDSTLLIRISGEAIEEALKAYPDSKVDWSTVGP